MENKEEILRSAENLHNACQEAIKAAKEALRILGEMK